MPPRAERRCRRRRPTRSRCASCTWSSSGARPGSWRRRRSRRSPPRSSCSRPAPSDLRGRGDGGRRARPDPGRASAGGLRFSPEVDVTFETYQTLAFSRGVLEAVLPLHEAVDLARSARALTIERVARLGEPALGSAGRRAQRARGDPGGAAAAADAWAEATVAAARWPACSRTSTRSSRSRARISRRPELLGELERFGEAITGEGRTRRREALLPRGRDRLPGLRYAQAAIEALRSRSVALLESESEVVAGQRDARLSLMQLRAELEVLASRGSRRASTWREVERGRRAQRGRLRARTRVRLSAARSTMVARWRPSSRTWRGPPLGREGERRAGAPSRAACADRAARRGRRASPASSSRCSPRPCATRGRQRLAPCRACASPSWPTSTATCPPSRRPRGRPARGPRPAGRRRRRRQRRPGLARLLAAGAGRGRPAAARQPRALRHRPRHGRRRPRLARAALPAARLDGGRARRACSTTCARRRSRRASTTPSTSCTRPRATTTPASSRGRPTTRSRRSSPASTPSCCCAPTTTCRSTARCRTAACW
jgi:hypothetical protein